MNTDFEAEIGACEQALTEIRGEMSQIEPRFIASAGEFLRKWYLEQAKSSVVTQASSGHELPHNRLSEFKAAVKDLSNGANATASEHLSLDSLWWHRSGNPSSYSFMGKTPPELIHKQIRLAAGLLGPVLKEFGVTDVFAETTSEKWLEWDSSGRYHPEGARPYYPYSLDWSEDMKSDMGAYSELNQKANQVSSRLGEIGKRKAEYEAGKLWDEA